MASWKKIIVSGSKADLSEVTASGGIITAGDLTVSGGDITLGTTSIFSGGNTTSLNNIDAIDATTEATIEAALDTLSNVTTVGALNAGSITSGFGNVDIGTSTFNAGNSTVDNFTNNSEVGNTHITGSITGSFTGDGSGLSGVAGSFPSTHDAGESHAATKFFVNDGASKFISGSQVANYVFGLVSGDAAIAAGGALTIAADSVENSMLANIARGSVKVGGTSNAPTDLDAKGDGKILVGDGTDIASVAVSGDITLANDGAVTIAANSVEGTMLNTNSADTSTIELSSDTLSVLKVPNALTVDNATIQLNSGTTFDGSGAKTISIKDGGVDADALAAAVAGAGLTGGGGSALAVGAGTGVTVNANDIAIGQAIGTGDSPTFTNLTLSGDLTVNGSTTTVNTANLLVEDRFILVNSGSDATGDGGLVVGSGSKQSGSTFIWDDSADRWGTQHDTQLKHDASTSAPEAYASLYVLTANTGSATYNVKGNIKTDDDTGDIFIYS